MADRFAVRRLSPATRMAHRPRSSGPPCSTSFYQVLPFGTGGRRGAVGIGPNRMNLWTLGASVQGHCEYLKRNSRRRAAARRAGLRRAAASWIAGRSTIPSCPIRCSVFRAKTFATSQPQSTWPTASTCTSCHRIRPRYYATPELSFVIRRLHAHGGLNISASHNPPDDNGGKFYDERGAQPVPPDDQIMSDLVDQVSDIKALPLAGCRSVGQSPFSRRRAPPCIHRIGEETEPHRAAEVRRNQGCVHSTARRRRHDGDGGAARPRASGRFRSKSR